MSDKLYYVVYSLLVVHVSLASLGRHIHDDTDLAPVFLQTDLDKCYSVEREAEVSN